MSCPTSSLTRSISHLRLFKSRRIPFKFNHLLYFRSKNFVFYFNLTCCLTISVNWGVQRRPVRPFFFKILTLSRKSRFHFVQDTAHCWFISTVSFRPCISFFLGEIGIYCSHLQMQDIPLKKHFFPKEAPKVGWVGRWWGGGSYRVVACCGLHCTSYVTLHNIIWHNDIYWYRALFLSGPLKWGPLIEWVASCGLQPFPIGIWRASHQQCIACTAFHPASHSFVQIQIQIQLQIRVQIQVKIQLQVQKQIVLVQSASH